MPLSAIEKRQKSSSPQLTKREFEARLPRDI